MAWAKMEKIFYWLKKYWLVLILLSGILVLGNNLREFSYSSVPHPGEVADEYSFGWLGLSLIEDKYPVAWSGLPAYDKHDFQRINVDGIFDKNSDTKFFSIDKPWFDHPPLFGLISGGYAYIKGAREFVDASVILLRRPMIKIAMITTVSIFILGWKLYGTSTGLLAALLYSVVPTTVISSRLALAENAYIPIFVISLISAIFYIDTCKRIYWALAVFLASAGLLFKLSAISIALTLVLTALLFGKKEKKFLIATVIGGVMIALLMFTIYGLYFDWNTFIKVFMTNSQRFYGAGSEIFFSAIVSSKITANRFLTDGWVTLAWIAMFVILFVEWKKERGGTILALPVVSYFVTFLIFGSEGYGWYRFPFLPFLLIALSRLLYKIFLTPNILLFVALMMLPFGTTVHRLIGVEGFQNYVPLFRYFIGLALGLFTLSLFKKDLLKNIQRIFIALIILSLVYFSIKEVFFFTYEEWFFAT